MRHGFLVCSGRREIRPDARNCALPVTGLAPVVRGMLATLKSQGAAKSKRPCRTAARPHYFARHPLTP
jgi:hypothetical protein